MFKGSLDWHINRDDPIVVISGGWNKTL